MKITFGLHLDGQRSWHRRDLLGQTTVGPLGMLNLLETFLGLPKPMSSEGERILQYREVLAELDNPERFYHQSFASDQYTVARTLLSWRDNWHMHGWNGIFETTVPHRLQDMAQVEKLSVGRLGLSFGERLKAVASSLEQREHPIESIQLIEPIDDFPTAWQNVLSKLTVIPHATGTQTATSTNLSRLQQALINAPEVAIPWANDESIVVVRSHSRLAAAGLLSGLCSQEPSNTLLVAEAEGALYDTLSSAYGNARLGISDKSELRPPLQLLTLAFALAWKPLDVFALLEFLAHPMSPLPRFASALLAKAVASQPGMGGEKWQQAISDIKKYAGDNAEAVTEPIEQWLQPPSIPAGENAPVALLEEIATRVAKSFRSKLGAEDVYTQRAQHSGNAQCTQIARALALLKKQGVTTISRMELSQLFEQTVVSGESSAASKPEVGSCLLATHPSAAIQPQNTVIWWNLAAPALPSSYPWHKHEISSLRAAGVALPEMGDVMEADARNWRQPVLAAKNRLVLALPPEGEEVHPIWLAIERVFESGSIPVRSVEDVLENKLGLVEPVKIPNKPLPLLRRWWHVNPESIPDRKWHSFSSLDKLLNNPMEWVLKYPANIAPPNILSVSGGNQLLGSLGHRAIELLHSEKDVLRWSPEEAAAWVSDKLQTLLEQEGAVLLLPGQRSTVEGFKHKLIPAVKELHRHLQSAQIVQVESEKELSGSFFMGELNGFIDILATRSDGQSAVLDMKWSRSKDFRSKLQDNKHLQLAIYGESVRQKTGKWAIPAYFIFTDTKLLALDKTFFPDAMVAPSRMQGGSALLWQIAQETLKWRHAQIRNGSIELNFEGTEADENSVPPDGALEVEGPSNWSGDYDHLAGWGADA